MRFRWVLFPFFFFFPFSGKLKFFYLISTEAPLVTSLPHFLHGDHVLSKGVTGLNPDVEKHESYIEVDPVCTLSSTTIFKKYSRGCYYNILFLQVMGIPVGGKSKLQLNVIVFGNGVYRNQYIFPITWMDYVSKQIHNFNFAFTTLTLPQT